MVTVKDLLNKLKGVDINSLTKLVIKENQKEILDLNRSKMDKGLDINGKTVGTYSKASEQFAKQNKPAKPKKFGKPYNFQDTLKLFNEMFLTHKNQKITIDSKGIDSHEKDLFIQDSKVLGLSKEDGHIVNYKILLPELQKKFKAITKL